MCGCVTPPPPSIPFGSNMPCQWTVVCSGSLLVTKMRTLSPSTASIVGPGHEGEFVGLQRSGAGADDRGGRRRPTLVGPQNYLPARRQIAHHRPGEREETSLI